MVASSFKFTIAICLVAVGIVVAWPCIASVICGATNGSLCLSSDGHEGGAFGRHREVGGLGSTLCGALLIVSGLGMIDSIR